MQLHLYKVACRFDNNLYPRKTAIILASNDDMAYDAAKARSGVREIISVKKIDGPFQDQSIIHFGQNMKLTLIALKQHDRKIQSIKALRSVTGDGLRETKDIVDRMIHDHRNGNAISCVVTVCDSHSLSPEIRKRDILELTHYFDFTGEATKKTIELKLWEVTCAMKISGSIRTSIAYILASDEQEATNTATHTNGVDSVIGCSEIKGPFKNGHLLFMWNGQLK